MLMARLPAFAAALAAVSLAILIGSLLQREAPDLVYGPRSDAEFSGTTVVKPLPGFEQRLQAALRFKTISSLAAPSHLEAPAEMLALHAHLKRSFPLTWKALKPAVVNDFSLLFEWEGSDAKAEPGLLISHLDVVPAAEDDEEEESETATATNSWASAGGGPFDGVLTNEGGENSYFVGRGSLDVKGGALALLEAVEALLSRSPSSSNSSNSSNSSPPPFSPRRTLFIALGHDEEVGGALGARAMAREIEGRLVARMRRLKGSELSKQEQGKQPLPPPLPPRLAFALDEGGVVLPDGLPSLLNVPVVAVATAEKGYASLRLDIRGNGGHSAMPPLAPAATAATALAKVAAAADARRPQPRLVRPTTDMLRAAGAASGVRGFRLGAAAVAWLAEFGEKKDNEVSFLLSLLARAFASKAALTAARASPPPVAAQLATTVAITKLETGLSGGGGEEEDEEENGSEGTTATTAKAAKTKTKAKAEKSKKAAAKGPRRTAKAADNVIPPHASMTLNYRPLPGDDAKVVPLQHLRRAAAAAGLAFDDDDEDKGKTPEKAKRRKNTNQLVTASVSRLRIEQASAVTPTDSKPMLALRRAISKSGMPGEKGMAVVVRAFWNFQFFFFFFGRDSGFFFFFFSTKKLTRPFSFSLSFSFFHNKPPPARAARRGDGQQGLPPPPLFSFPFLDLSLSFISSRPQP
jgi:acetylornithine deacetylase/succinyl-diaminopimelate desuccinylase-like protein